MIEAREIDRDTLRAVMALSVAEEQRGLLAANAVTIAQASLEPFSAVRGLWAGDVAVGLIAMIDHRPEHPDFRPDDPKNAAYLWRLMIDHRHQRKGYGTQAIELAFGQARAWGRDIMMLHVAEGAGNAVGFYRRFGLTPTGRVDEGEALLVGPVPPA